MFQKKLTVFFLLLLSLSIFIIAGCGKEQTTTTTNTLDEIKKRGVVIVGTEAVVPPYEFVEDGKIVGYNADILNEIVKNLGVELEHHDVEWKGILSGLEAKKFDFLATSVAVTPERKEKFGMTTPVGELIYVFVKNIDDSSINSQDDLYNKKVGCTTGSANEKYLKAYNEQLIKDGKDGFEIVFFTGMPDAFLALKNGQVDALLSSETTTLDAMKKSPDTYEIVSIFDTNKKEYTAWAVRKEDAELLAFLNAEILKLKENGTLAQLQEKWFGRTFDLPDEN